MKIKVCGMCRSGNMIEVARLRPDMMGFIFYPPSPRYAGGLPFNIVRALPDEIEKTGVFVNEDMDKILKRSSDYGLQVLQLHGDESPEDCFRLRNNGYRVIKAIGISNNCIVESVLKYEDSCDGLLFDTLSPVRGGTGIPFDWSLLKAYTGNLPFFLSGGISEEHLEKIRNLKHPRLLGIDLNSRFEVYPGEKDIRMLEQFIVKIREIKDDK